MVLAIEPMINLGTHKTRSMPDGWLVCTRDGLPSAHFEKTVAVTEHGPDDTDNRGGVSSVRSRRSLP